jgi:ABC-2 type transport system permease protein
MIKVNIKKEISLVNICARLEIMDRMESVVDFVLVSVGVLVSIAVNIIFFKSIFLRTSQIGGWSLEQVYLLLGVYNLIMAIGWMTYMRGFYKIPRMIERGDFDQLLSKPLNLRLFLSYRYIDLLFSAPIQLVAALGLIIYALRQADTQPYYWLFAVILLCGIIIHYSIMLMLNTVSFFYLMPQATWTMNELSDLGKFPLTIYKGFMRIVLSFIIPIGIIFSFPSRAIVGDIGIRELVTAIVVATIMFWLSDRFWKAGLKRYSSANG